MDSPVERDEHERKRLCIDGSLPPPSHPSSPAHSHDAHDTSTPLTHARVSSADSLTDNLEWLQASLNALTLSQVSALQTASAATPQSNPASPASETPPGSSPLPLPAGTPTPEPEPASSDLHYRPQFLLRGHTKEVTAVKWSPNGRLIASASADATLRIWDAATGKKIHVCKGHLAGISTMAWSSDSALIATGSDDKNIVLWDAVTGRAYPKPLTGHHNYVYSLAFSPKGNMLVSGSYDEAVFIWDVRGGRLMRSLPAHSDPVSGVDFVRDGTLIASCSTDGLLRVWDADSGQCLKTIYHEDRPGLTCVLFVPNGRYIAAWSLDGCIRIWEYLEGRCAKTYKGHVNNVFSLGGCFGTYTTRKMVKSRVPRHTLPNQDQDKSKDEDHDMDATDNNSDTSSTSDDDAHKTTKANDMVEIEQEQQVIAAFLASGSEDGRIFLWDVISKEVMQRLEGHQGVVFAVDAHPTEKRLVSCSADKTIRVWTAEPKEEPAAAAAVDIPQGEDAEAKADADTEMQDLVKEVALKSEVVDAENDHDMGGV